MSSLVDKSIFYIFPMLLATVYGGLERACTISNIISIGCSFQKLEKRKKNYNLKLKPKFRAQNLSVMLVFIPTNSSFVIGVIVGCYTSVFIHLVVWNISFSIQSNECKRNGSRNTAYLRNSSVQNSNQGF